MLIGICGSTGSGKTVFARKIADEIGSDDCLIIQQDSYYMDRSHLTRDEAEKTNYDHPDSIEFSLLEKHLESLKRGMPVRIPHYDYAEHKRTPAKKETVPGKMIILEGILIFQSARIRDLLDLKIFLFVDEEIRLARRIERDIRERGRTRQEVITQYYDSVQPMDRKYVVPSMQWADIVIPFSSENPASIRIVSDCIKASMSKK